MNRKTHPGFLPLHRVLLYLENRARWDEGDFAAHRLCKSLENFLLELWYNEPPPSDWNPVQRGGHGHKGVARL